MGTSTWLIRDVTVIDGTGVGPAPGWAVLVDDGVIAWTGPQDLAPAVPDHAVVEGGGGYLLPGMIDSHVHLTGEGCPDLMAQILGDSTAMGAYRAVRNARRNLDCGVTTVRDLGAADGIVIDLARAIDEGIVVGPRVVAAGRVITMTGGHGHFVGREVDSPEQARHAVRAEIKEGAQFIKIMSTGGVLTPGVTPLQIGLTLEELRAAVEAAHNADKLITTHSIGRRGLLNALTAGVDSIEHGFYLDEELFQLAIDRNVVLVPTLTAVTGIAEFGPAGGTPSWAVEKAQAELERAKAMFRSAVNSGMAIAAGTDAGTPFNGHSPMVRELELMVECGMTPMQALVAATSGGAANLRLQHLIGSITVGRRADLIVAAADPLADLRALTDLRLIARDGVRYVDRLSAS